MWGGQRKAMSSHLWGFWGENDEMSESRIITHFEFKSSNPYRFKLLRPPTVAQQAQWLLG